MRVIVAFSLAFILVITMTGLWRFGASRSVEVPLSPGLVTCMLLITGPHGGTVGQENLALPVSVAINTAVYGLVILGAIKIGEAILKLKFPQRR